MTVWKTIAKIFRPENIYLALFVILFSGLTSFIVGLPSVPLSATFIPSQEYESLFEFIVLVLVNTLGVYGAMLVTRSRAASTTRMARIYVLAGVILVIVWAALIYALYFTVY